MGEPVMKKAAKDDMLSHWRRRNWHRHPPNNKWYRRFYSKMRRLMLKDDIRRGMYDE